LSFHNLRILIFCFNSESGLGRVLSVECGDDLSKVRLEMFGNRVTLPGNDL
jgi:hypothetical protein